MFINISELQCVCVCVCFSLPPVHSRCFCYCIGNVTVWWPLTSLQGTVINLYSVCVCVMTEKELKKMAANVCICVCVCVFLFPTQLDKRSPQGQKLKFSFWDLFHPDLFLLLHTLQLQDTVGLDSQSELYVDVSDTVFTVCEWEMFNECLPLQNVKGIF